MFKIMLMGVVFIGIFFWEAPDLVRKKEIKELFVFSILLMIGFVLSIVAIHYDYIWP